MDTRMSKNVKNLPASNQLHHDMENWQMELTVREQHQVETKM